MLMPGRSVSDFSYRFGLNGQEKSTELNSNLFTAQFWEYDSRVGRRWNKDPRPSNAISPYSTFYSNPVWFSDKFGDSSIIDNKGYIVHYDSKDKDLRVFMLQNGKLSLIGELGNKIDANVWFKNLLKENSESADDLWDPGFFGDNFKNRVKQYGVWDYKYRSPANNNSRNSKLPFHILGIAFYRGDKAFGSGDLAETQFSFDGNTGRAEDLNNYHFGVVGKAFGEFTEEFMLRTAGKVEMEKREDEFRQGKWPSPLVPLKWRPVIGRTFTRGDDGKGGIEDVLGPPYGDNPVDHDWIKRGFKYYKLHSKELDGD